MSKSIYPSSVKNCLNCQSEISKHKKFCDNSCAASYNNKRRSETSRKKQANSVSKTMKQKVDDGTHKTQFVKGKLLISREERICPSCKSSFEVRITSERKYCSYQCSTTKPNQGGYREGSGRSKSGRYQGYYCGSTYELAWIIYQLDHNNPFKRFPGYLTDGKLKYYPDFLLPDNTIIEIKGYHTEAVDRKADLARANGYNIQILYREDLEDVFNYVCDKYQIPQLKLHTLYN